MNARELEIEQSMIKHGSQFARLMVQALIGNGLSTSLDNMNMIGSIIAESLGVDGEYVQHSVQLYRVYCQTHNVTPGTVIV
jgi:hypothetical protein